MTVIDMVTGFPEVGLTALPGENTHAAPAGNPMGQVRETVPENDPEAVT